jgi:hypothetical protein
VIRGRECAGLATLALALLPALAGAQDTTVELNGHVKYRLLASTWPDDSLLHDLAGEGSLDQALELRLNLDVRNRPWELDVDYQLLGLYGDTVEFTRDLPAGARAFFQRYPRDDTRLVDLTHIVYDEGRGALVQRLDRLAVSYLGAKTVVRLGRQALTWGNGLIYTPMDILNPFDPAAVDKEYKIGDDMLYTQYLRDNGDDLQGVVVARRGLESGKVEADQSSFALKYHGLAGKGEFDLLAARHFGDPLAAGGGSLGVGGAVWRGDLVLTFTGDHAVAEAVTSVSYSWVWAGRNFDGLAEYFFNGFGQPDGRYAPGDLAANPELVQRLVRGELFTLGRHYVATSVLVELHPLHRLTPNVFVNLSDGSALVQVVSENDLARDLVLLGALGVPLGPSGTEFGGIEATVPGRYLSSGPSAFLQLAWYF